MFILACLKKLIELNKDHNCEVSLMKVKKDVNPARASSKYFPLRIEFENLKEPATDVEISKILLNHLKSNTESLFNVSEVSEF